MFAKYKKIIITVLVLILGFLVWSIFIKADPEIESLLLVNEAEEVDKLSEEVIQTLDRIRSINLEKDVFGHPIFIRLEDYSKEITPQVVGRPDPFKPFNAPSVPLSVDRNSVKNILDEPKTTVDAGDGF